MKTVLSALILLSFLSTSEAQLIRGFGFKLGSTISNFDYNYHLSENYNFETENRVGLNFGIFAELIDNPFFTIIAEFNYVQRGDKITANETTNNQPVSYFSTIPFDRRVDYISISTVGKFRLENGKISPYIIAGPKIDFEINRSFSSIRADFIEDEFNNNIIGFKVGVGSEINLISVILLAEILYESGISDLFEHPKLNISSSSIDFRLGLML